MALIEGIATLVAKIASASTVAQATAGLGIAVAGVTGAGAAGALPGPVQDTVAGAVEAITPFEMPHATDDRGADVRHTAADDHQDDGPAVVPTTALVAPAAAAPTTEAAENETENENEAEHGTETADGTHQHRGGRTVAPVAAVPSADDSTEAPEVEDDHGGDDSSGHGGDDSGESSGGSGHDDGSGHEDGSGHGGDD
jgi:hypothetical protein